MKGAFIIIKERIRGIVKHVDIYLHSLIFYFSIGVCVWCNKGVCKMKVDKNYYVSVKDLMTKTLPRPALKKTILVNDGEWLPIVSVECGLWE